MENLELEDTECVPDENNSSCFVLKMALTEFMANVREKLRQSLGLVVTRDEKRKIKHRLREIERLIASNQDDHVYGDNLAELKRLFYPLERRLSERQLALRSFMQTIQLMRQWIQYYREDPELEAHLTPAKLDRLDRVLDEYEKWFRQQTREAHSRPEDFALKTAQIIAHNQALEVAWVTIIDESDADQEQADCKDNEDISQLASSNGTEDLNLARQSMENFIYELTRKLEGPLNAFVNQFERRGFLSLLQEVSHWLNSEGHLANADDFEDRMIRLENIGLIIEHRLFERVELVKQYKYYIEQYRRVLSYLQAGDPFYVQLLPSQTAYLQAGLDEYEKWLRHHQLTQQRVQDHGGPVSDDPQLSTERIAEKLRSLQNFWNSLVNIRILRPCSSLHNYENSPQYDYSQSYQTNHKTHTITIKLSGRELKE